jgi:hypothetical protein
MTIEVANTTINIQAGSKYAELKLLCGTPEKVERSNLMS